MGQQNVEAGTHQRRGTAMADSTTLWNDPASSAVNAPQSPYTQSARQLGDVAIPDAAHLAVGIHHEVRFTARSSLQVPQQVIILVVASGEPHRLWTVLVSKDGVCFLAEFSYQTHA